MNRQWRPGRLLLWLVALIPHASSLAAAPAPSQFTPFARGSQSILEGNWQSCREADGRYSERVYDHVVNGAGQFEVHMGPRNEFAIFQGVQDEHRDHASSDNLLSPYRVVMESGRARQRWEIAQLNIVLTVTLAGGSRTDCDSWFVLLEPLKKPSH